MFNGYPAVMTFELSADRPYRQQAIDAAVRLGLVVKILDGDRFEVEIPSHEVAYRFGAESGVAPRTMASK